MLLKTQILLAFVLFWFCVEAAANGGPHDVSTPKKIGEIQLKSIPGVKLQEENLLFDIKGDVIEIEVVYKLKNELDSQINVDYAFPLDFMANDMFDYDGSFMHFPTDLRGWYDDIPLVFKGNPIDIDSLRTDGNKLVKQQNGKMQFSRQWFTTAFTIASEAIGILKVSYKIKPGFFDSDDPEHILPGFGNREILWDFSPAQNWGDGKAGKISILINAKFINVCGEKIDIKGLNFKEKDGIHSFQAEKFDMQKAEPLQITYSYEAYLESQSLLSRESRIFPQVNVTASSFLNEKYLPEYALDGDLSTMWIEGAKGQGIGEWIQIEFIQPFLCNIGLLVSGDMSSKAAYMQKNRIKRIEVMSKTDIGIYIDTVDFEDKTFLYGSDCNNISYYGQFLPVVGNYCHKCRITILDIYKGTENTTSLSELFFFYYKP